jgi:hypothetical protein
MSDRFSSSARSFRATFHGIAARLTRRIRRESPRAFGLPSLTALQSAALFFSLALFAFLRSYPLLTPQPAALNAHDQAEYIQSGADLLAGKLRPLAYHPLVSVVYAAASLPFSGSTLSFIYTEWLTRVLLYFGLWLAVWLFAREFNRFFPPWALAALWAVHPLPDRLLSNTSQILFVILATLALRHLLRYAADRRTSHLVAASLWLGLAFLARNEALWIFLFAIPMVLLLDLLPPKEAVAATVIKPVTTFLSRLAGLLVPFALCILIYQGLYIAATGSTETGLPVRTYDALEAGQGLTYPEQYPGDPFISGIPDSRRIYGTRQENGFSVIAAALRNPSAMIDRVIRNMELMPVSMVQGLGGYIGTLLILFVLLGMAALTRSRQWRMLAVLLAFSLFELLYIPFFWLSSYWLFLFPVVFALGAIGIRWFITESGTLFRAVAFLAGLGALAAAVCLPSWTLAYIALASLAVIVLTTLHANAPARAVIGGAALAGLGLLLVNPAYVQNPELLPDVGSDPAVQTAQWLRAHTPPDAKVTAWGATTVYLSGRPFLSLEGFLDTPARMADWLAANNVAYLYADGYLAGTFPDLMPVVASLAADGCLDPVFEDDRSTGTLYTVTPGCMPR